MDTQIQTDKGKRAWAVLPADEYLRVKLHALARGRKVGEWVLDAIREKLAREGGNGSTQGA